MGMDYVEIMMDLETEFDIRFNDDSHQPAKTVGELCDEVVRTLNAKGGAIDAINRDTVFDRVCLVVGETLGIDPVTINEHDRLVDDLGAT